MSNGTDDLQLSLEQLTASAELDYETRAAFADVLAAIRVHGRELLAYPGVVSVRPGYRFRGAHITPQPSVRVAVMDKRDSAELLSKDMIPRRLGSVLVDVVPASPLEQLDYLRRSQDFDAAGGVAGAIYSTFVGTDEAAQAGAEGLVAKNKGLSLSPYVPPPNAPLQPVTEAMTVLCHASPDAGWRNLHQFLLGTKHRLTATMYEFNAVHI
ncbi:MAG: hypothetical protein ACJ74Q_19330 [Pyrinomonadaceae bacterium]